MSCLTCLVFNCVYCFFLKRLNYIKVFVLQNKPYFCRNFFLADWCHKRLKNTIDLLLFLQKTLLWIFGKCTMIYDVYDRLLFHFNEPTFYVFCLLCLFCNCVSKGDFSTHRKLLLIHA